MEINGKMMTSTIREEIITAISSIISFDTVEKEHLDFAKDWITSGAEIFRIAKPDKPNIHLVSYFIKIFAENW
jgi:8-oxo-dGTP diphosphatase